jgi:hypothetical protein
MEDIEAGRLFKAIYSYENGSSPKFSDRTVEIAFQFFKTHLDRDSKKWEEVKEKRQEAGSKGGKKKAENQKQRKHLLEVLSNSKHTQANQAVIVSESDIVSYVEYINILKSKDRLWATTLEKGLGLKPGKVWNLIDLFVAHLESQRIQHKTLEDFKTHFQNRLNKENQYGRLDPYKVNKNGAL